MLRLHNVSLFNVFLVIFISYLHMTIRGAEKNENISQLISYAHQRDLQSFKQLNPKPEHIKLFGWNEPLTDEELMAGYRGEQKSENQPFGWHTIISTPNALEIALSSPTCFNKLDRNDHSLLGMALRCNKEDLLNRLLEKEDIDLTVSESSNNNYGTILHYAVIEENKYALLEKLLKNPKINLNMLNSDGNPVWHMALENYSLRALNLLIDDTRTNLNTLNNWNKTLLASIQTNLEFLKECQESPTIETLQALEGKLLSDKRTDPGIKNENGQTLLHSACSKMSNSLVTFCLSDTRMKPAINALDNAWQTALDIAYKSTHEDRDNILKQLQEYNAQHGWLFFLSSYKKSGTILSLGIILMLFALHKLQ